MDVKIYSVTINIGAVLPIKQLKSGHHGDKKKEISKMEPPMTKAMHLIFKGMQISALSNRLTRHGLSTLLPFISRAGPRKEMMEGYSIFKCIQT